MGDLLIRDISPVLHEKLKRLSRERELSISELSKEALRKGIEEIASTPANDRLSAWGAFRGVFGDALLSDAEHAMFEADLEQARWQPHRPQPDME